MRRRVRVQIGFRQTVHTHCASVHQAAKLVAALLRVAGVTAGLVESNGSLPLGLWFTSPAADCQEPGSAPEPYARQSSMGCLFKQLVNFVCAHVVVQKGEFVIDRRDMDNYRSFPIWKVDSPRLLQKYEAFERNGRLLHRAVCTVWCNCYACL